jgi:protein gp37
MGRKTHIEWSNATWNPTRGCSRVSAGCDNCYAVGVSHRFSGVGLPYEGLTVLRNGKPDFNGKITLAEEHLLDPLRWKKPKKIFVNSMSDVFHHNVPDSYIDRMFAVMALATQHTFQLLTKRPERMQAYMKDIADKGSDRIRAAINQIPNGMGDRRGALEIPLFNVWLGVSVEDQKAADWRIPILLGTPAAVRFISAEPLLGSIDLKPYLLMPRGADPDNIHYPKNFDKWTEAERTKWCQDTARHTYMAQRENILDWVIVGGESGPGARAFNVQWAKRVVKDCKKAGVAVFVKQLGSHTVMPYKGKERLDRITGNFIDNEVGVRFIKSRKGGDMEEWPFSELKVREFPKGAKA